MTQIILTVTDQEISFSSSPVVASGGVSEDEVVFNFDSAWDSYSVKTAVFYNDTDNVYHVLVSSNKATIPHEVLADKGYLYIGVFGQYGTSIKTSAIVKYKIENGAITTATAVTNPSPTVYAQIISAYQQTINSLSSALTNAQQALTKANQVLAEVTTARGNYDTLNDRLDEIVGGTNVQTQTVITDGDVPFLYQED